MKEKKKKAKRGGRKTVAKKKKIKSLIKVKGTDSKMR